MRKLTTIESRFRDIARSSNISGEVSELLIKLLAYDVYAKELSLSTKVLELSPNRQVNTNSKIESAVNEMYSIYRGVNPRIAFKVRITGELELNTYDRIFNDNFNTFLYSHAMTSDGDIIYGNYKFIYGQEYTIYGIRSKTYEEEVLIATENDIHLLESLSGNISEDYILYAESDPSTYLKTTKIFRSHIDDSLRDDTILINPQPKKLFDLTISDFGVRFYSPEAAGFTVGINYIFRYIKFDPTPIDKRSLQKIKLDGAEIDYTSFVITTPGYRESLSGLLYKLKKHIITQSRVRTNSDLLDQLNMLFGYKLKDAALGEYDINTNILNILYIPLEPNIEPSSFELTSSEKQVYIDSLMYYVTDNITFTPVYDSTNSVKVIIKVSIKSNSNLLPQELEDYIKSLEYKLGGSVNKNKILGVINDSIEVEYSTCELILEDGTIVEEIQVDSDKYLILYDLFQYSFLLN